MTEVSLSVIGGYFSFITEFDSARGWSCLAILGMAKVLVQVIDGAFIIILAEVLVQVHVIGGGIIVLVRRSMPPPLVEAV